MENFHSSASAAGISLILRSQRAGVVEEDQLRHLLGDRRAALHRLAGAQVDQRGAGGAAQVDAEVPVEAAVLGGDDRVDQVRRHRPRRGSARAAGRARRRSRPSVSSSVTEPPSRGSSSPSSVGQLAHVVGGGRPPARARRATAARSADPPEQAEEPREEARGSCAPRGPGRGLAFARLLPVLGHASRSARLLVLCAACYADCRRSASHPRPRPRRCRDRVLLNSGGSSPTARQHSPIFQACVRWPRKPVAQVSS